MITFQPRFELSELKRWADAYMDGPDNDTEEHIEKVIIPKVKQDRYLDKASFLTVCEWKSPRPKKHYEANSEEFVREASAQALFSATTEEMRVGVLTLLRGVNLPVASVFLHFFHSERYPIIDYRALESLGIKREDQPTLEFDLWWQYTLYCRHIADTAPGKPSMRDVDRALWEFSKQNPF